MMRVKIPPIENKDLPKSLKLALPKFPFFNWGALTPLVKNNWTRGKNQGGI